MIQWYFDGASTGIFNDYSIFFSVKYSHQIFPSNIPIQIFPSNIPIQIFPSHIPIIFPSHIPTLKEIIYLKPNGESPPKIPLLGQPGLGENECIFMIATVGLSVDYTVGKPEPGARALGRAGRNVGEAPEDF